jgi:hypothetical protein
MPPADNDDDLNNNNNNNNKASKASRTNNNISETRNSRVSSTISLTTTAQSQQPSPTKASLSSDTPLTPEESPPFYHQQNQPHNHQQHQQQHYQGKRSAEHALLDDEDINSEVTSPSSHHTRDNSAEEPLVNFCLCQPEPKVPRPRNGKKNFPNTPPYANMENKKKPERVGKCVTDFLFFFAAFILYRQNRQAAVVASNPGFANPDISKIIGEQWRNEPEVEKNRWKAYAEVSNLFWRKKKGKKN